MTTKTKTYSYFLTHDGRAYVRTGKTGHRIDSGEPVVEMQARDHSRIWVDARDNVYPE
jgi:hypothetical protein